MQFFSFVDFGYTATAPMSSLVELPDVDDFRTRQVGYFKIRLANCPKMNFLVREKLKKMINESFDEVANAILVHWKIVVNGFDGDGIPICDVQVQESV